jgi:DinB superfamily
MQIIIQELLQVVRAYRQKISAIPDTEFYAKPNPKKWSKIEVLGHLTDSAQNNLRRFICGQYESTPPWIVYDQDFWVESNNYGQANKDDIINLWTLLNERIAEVLRTMPENKYRSECNTGNEIAQFRSLEWLAADYVKHLKHHLNQILPRSFDVVYP